MTRTNTRIRFSLTFLIFRILKETCDITLAIIIIIEIFIRFIISIAIGIGKSLLFVLCFDLILLVE